MSNDRFSRTLESLTPRKQEQFRQAIQELDSGISSGQIPNAVFTRAKFTVSRMLDYAWGAAVQKPYCWNREYISQAGDEEREVLRSFSGHPQVNTVAKMIRQCGAIGDTQAGRAIQVILSEASQALDLVKAGKDIAVKKQAAPKLETATERYSAPSASQTGMAEVLRELRDITENARDSIAASLVIQHQDMVTRFLDAQKAHPERKAFSIYGYVKDICDGRADPYLRMKLEASLDRTRSSGKETYQKKSNIDEIISTSSLKEADEICASFIERTLSKLAPIVEQKGDYRGMEIIGRQVSPGAMEGRLRLSFEDGSSFEARSQGVMSFSQYGTPFMRFPLTFHDVKLSNGEFMDRPSEKKMNENFAKTPDNDSISPT